MTPTFEYPAFVTVKARSRSEADRLAEQMCDNSAVHVNEYVNGSVSLDDGEPSVEDDE